MISQLAQKLNSLRNCRKKEKQNLDHLYFTLMSITALYS